MTRPSWSGIPHCALNDVPVTHGRLRDIRTLFDGYPGDRVMVGEVYLLSTEAVATYYGEGGRAAPVLQLPAAVGAVVASRPMVRLHRRHDRRPSTPGRPGPPGCCPTTTIHGTAPATTAPPPGAVNRPGPGNGGARRGPGRPPCSC